MRDVNKSNGTAMLATWKRSGRTAPAMSNAGLAKSAPITTTSHAPHGQQGSPANRVSRTSDFEGFGSFSS
jgi:hypothetical protein